MTRSRFDALASHITCETMLPDFPKAQASDSNWAFARCSVPISLVQLGETLGMGIATVNRTLRELRASGTVDFRDGNLTIVKWRDLQRLGDFNSDYLHMKRHRSRD